MIQKRVKPVNNPRTPIEVIDSETRDAIEALKQLSLQSEQPWTKGDDEELQDLLRSYRKALERVARMPMRNRRKKQKAAEKLLLRSFAGRVSAVLRTLLRFGHCATKREVFTRADKLNVWQALSEPVLASWYAKPDGGSRLICKDGPLRTAQRLLLRDMFSLMEIESEHDFSKKGAGGERALVKNVCSQMTAGYSWWVSTDIKDCFPSLRPAHFNWLPTDRRLLQNVVFLPKCAKIKVVGLKEHKSLIQILKTSCPDHNVNSIIDLVKFTIQKVRQGLSQGSVLSPLLARGFVGRELRASLGAMKVVSSFSADDVYLGACDRKGAEAAWQAFKQRLNSHPAGPIELHQATPVHTSTGQVSVLGYKLRPGKGYGNNPVHVVPGPKRINRFKNRLTQRLLRAGPNQDLLQLGLKYWCHWYPSQQAWTKVPHYSYRVSQGFAYGYIDDFKNEVPMGKNWTKGFSNKTAFYS